MTKEEALKKLQAIKSYMISGNPMWSVEPIGEAMDMAIEALEQSQWIPCGERLPEAGQGCLVCHNGAIGIDTFIGHDHPYKWNLYVRDYDAWMPLPEPWKGEDR